MDHKVPETPELEKLAAVSDQTQAAGEFIDWLQDEHGIFLAGPDRYPVGRSLDALLAEWQGIDRDKLEQEKRAIIAYARAQHGDELPMETLAVSDVL